MRVVEVHTSVASLGKTFNDLRRWLNYNHCTPRNFDYAFEPPEKVVIEIAFEENDLAEKFQQEFEQAEWISTGAHGRRAARATGRTSQAGRDGRGGGVKESDDERRKQPRWMPRTEQHRGKAQ